MGVTEEAGRAVGGVVTAIGTQPMALALVVMNLLLLGYMFYVQSSSNKQRQETVGLIVQQQNDTEKLLASCVSVEVSRNMMDNMQKITETMLNAEQKEITRMQEQINNERNRSWELRQREQKELDDLKRQQSAPPEPKAQRLNYTPLPSALGWTPLRLPQVNPDIPWLPVDGP